MVSWITEKCCTRRTRGVVDMDYELLLNEIINIGKEMIKSGAETDRAEDSMYRMLESYDLEQCSVFAIQSDIQATIKPKDGYFITQIRRIHITGFNYDRLDYLPQQGLQRGEPGQKHCGGGVRQLGLHDFVPGQGLCGRAAAGQRDGRGAGRFGHQAGYVQHQRGHCGGGFRAPVRGNPSGAEEGPAAG